MLSLPFSKYQGTGNDFVMVDNRTGLFEPYATTSIIAKLCDRRFGIGADGLILLQSPSQEGHDFDMVYYNADGNQSTMCGNGGRCIVAFAHHLGLVQDDTTFMAVDGLHTATIDDLGQVALGMIDVSHIHQDHEEGPSILNTGSPHFVTWTDSPDQLEDINVNREGRLIRNLPEYAATGGVNVNFVALVHDSHLRLRTYERGVEDETLACGTGAVAAALVAADRFNQQSPILIDVNGGQLEVSFVGDQSGYCKIVLKGPATFVFSGVWPVPTETINHSVIEGLALNLKQ
jgi:diaminopimelate epimerase